MTATAEPAPLGDGPDLTACDREPIHIPGHIQPHGVLIATAPGSDRISHLSENLATSLGLPAGNCLGDGLDALVGRAAFAAIRAALDNAADASPNVLRCALPIPIRPLRTVLAHRWEGRIIVELEDAPARDAAGAALSEAQTVIAGLRRAETVAELCDAAARQLRHLTGYDRVMVYRFDAEGHGTVVAEAKADHLPPYLHLRYPASDIPRQARRLYVLQRVRAIPDRDYRPVRLLSADPAPLDLSCSSLRGISPVHIEYMRNMGVRASCSISLLQDGGLWGMIVCHHMTIRTLAPELRALCDVIGQLLALLLQRAAETEVLAARLARGGMITALRDQLAASCAMMEGLSQASQTLLQLQDAGGGLIRCGGETRVFGRAPPPEAAAAIVDGLAPRPGALVLAVSDAGVPGGVAERFADTASGILVMKLAHHPGDAIAWFRPEWPRTVCWGGDPGKPAARPADGGPLSPRQSFAAWSELQRGRSAPWTPADLQVAEDVRQAITGALLSQAERQLAHLSAHDPLTALANRRTIEARLNRWSIDAAPATAALLFVDLDRFKSINDTLGHQAGDQCLVELATRLRGLAPPGSLAGRLGGDEFVLFWPGADRAGAQALAEALVAEFARPLLVRGGVYHAGASIGIDCATLADAEGMIRRADVAMYAAKRQGGGRAVVFRAEMQAAAVSNVRTGQDLYRAVENHQLEIYYQPVVSVEGHRIRGFEALLRWNHPERGWVSPAEFIPRAEEAGLIARLGAWVLGEVISQAAAWRKIEPALIIGANVSARQLTDGTLVRRLPELLSAAELPPPALCLEVTESALMDEAAVRELDLLRALGIRIAVDDFGTGYSSLSYLQRLPVDTVKIDRSFVAPLGSSAKADRFFTAIVDLARTLDLRTIAEGCETSEQWRVIKAAGCDAVQGWLVAPALDAAAAERFLGAPPAMPKAHATIRSPTDDLWQSSGPDQPTLDQIAAIRHDRLAGDDVFFAAAQLSRLPMTIADPRRADMPLVFVNRAFEVMTGYDKTAVLGRNCRFLQGPATDPDTVRQIRAGLAARQRVAAELINYRSDGTSFLNVVHICPVLDPAGQLVYFVASQMDVTRRH